MKQVISIADFATILNVINDKIQNLEGNASFLVPFYTMNKATEKERQKQIEERQKQIENNLRELKKNPYYKSLIHAKKALEKFNIEIEAPDLEVEK